MNELMNDKGGHRAARAAKNTNTVYMNLQDVLDLCCKQLGDKIHLDISIGIGYIQFIYSANGERMMKWRERGYGDREMK